MGDVLKKRIAAGLIDIAIISVLLVVIAKGFGDEQAGGWSLWAETEGRPRTVFLLLTFAYFFGTELAWSKTVGKRIMKLRVVSIDGAALTAGPVFLRNLLRLVDWLPGLYVIGAAAVFATGDRRQRLGDLVAKTQVVADDDSGAAPPPPDRPDDDEVLARVLR